MDKINLYSSIWDLHIHTCKCPKGSEEFSRMSTIEYIDFLCETFANYPNLKMISFTDHNHLSEEVYKNFYNRNTGITLIPGVEVDIYLDAQAKLNNDFKHVIFYFDNEKFELDNHASKINDKLKNNTPILLSEFLSFLLDEISVPFLISPHFLKQGKRGVEFNWFEDNYKQNLDKYIDQMICFWETANVVEIERAINLLKEFEREDKVSIISFSDSNNKEKLINYLSKPKQYFNSLPNFEGLRMVGSDCRRITSSDITISKDNYGKYIGYVQYGDCIISLSNRLNTIIGGRGMGKSLLLDGIARYIAPSKTDKVLEEDRCEYLENLKYKVFDMNHTDLKHHSFSFDYYNQGYVLKLFGSGNDDLVSSTYFSSEFSKLKSFNLELVKTEIVEAVSFTEEPQIENENISSIIEKVIYISNQKNDLKIKASKEVKEIDYLTSELTSKLFGKLVPDILLNNEKIIQKEIELLSTIQEEIFKHNESVIFSNFLARFDKIYKEKLGKINLSKKVKNSTISYIKKAIKRDAIDIINRVSQINSLLRICDKNYCDKSEIQIDGFEGNKFIFVRKLNVENILIYLHRVFNDYFDSNKVKKYTGKEKKNIGNLYELIKLYCYTPNDVLQDSKSLSDLYKELKELTNLKVEKVDDILYSHGGVIERLRDLSPGTKANILMEYIVHKDTEIPLLIDQPEDNIDNKTIFGVLTQWFNSLKYKRQIIVVTHDANIVVNSDSENVIVCNQEKTDQFEYKNGALEFDDIIENVSSILDGGSSAIQRRLIKYGRTNN